MSSGVNADEWELVVSPQYGKYYRPSANYHERQVREMIANGLSEREALIIQRARISHWRPQ